MSVIVECKDLTVKYGNKVALNNFSVEFQEGKIVGLLGPNGSGKTTFIKTLSGLITKSAGNVTIAGEKLGTATKGIVSYLPERPYFPTSMKVKDMIEFFKDFYSDFNPQTAYEMLETLKISPNDKIKALSKGTREKVQLVLVMSRSAKLYLLDEPMGGVDPAARDFILKTILTNYSKDACVVISTHLIQDVEQVLDEVVFIKEGRLAMFKSADEIREENGKSIDGLFREVFAC